MRQIVAMPKTRHQQDKAEIAWRVEEYRRQVERSGHIEHWYPSPRDRKDESDER